MELGVFLYSPSMLSALLVGAALLLPTGNHQSFITLDFTATVDGQAVKDLTSAEVSVKVAGKNRPLTSLEFIPTHDGGRNVLLLVDEPTLYAMEPIVTEAVGKLLSSLRPTDRISFASTRRGHLVPLTDEHERVKRVLAAMVTGPGALYTCMTDLSRTIETLAKAMPRGRASTLVVLSRGADEDPEFGDNGASGCTPRKDFLRDISEAVTATQINLHFFTVDPNAESWGMLSLASTIGGSTGRLSWSDRSGLDRLLASQTGFYRATFAADPSAPERPQRLDIKTTRKKVKLKAPSLVRLK